MKKKHLLILFAAFATLAASAHDFEVNGIYYNITSSTTAEVTYKGSSYSSNDYSGTITIPTTVPYEGVNYSVTSIGKNAFYDCFSLTAITIPENSQLTSIGDWAFSGCSSLTAINIPENSQLTSIGDEAFWGCYNLTSIILPKSVTSIGDLAFGHCSSLYKVINYSDLDIQIRSNDNGSVAYYAEVVYQGGELTTIGDFQFYTSDGIHSLVNYIGKDTGIVLPDSYNGESYNIGDFTFYGCSSLTAITIPENSQLTSIGEYAFYNCCSLTVITIPENSQLTSIGEYAFYNCRSLTAITIPEGVTSIGSVAFYGCSSLKEVTFGKGLKKIASGSFSGCSLIEKITIHATQPPATDGYIFDEVVYENATLYVPQGSIAKYQVMTGWSGFYNILEMEGGTPDYLTIRQADNGEVGIAVDLGRSYKVCITPSTGWTIHSVTFNGKDMTAQLSADNTFTTPTLTASAVLNVAYVKEVTAINNANASRLSVRGHNGIISISGAAEDEAITIYTLDGTMVASEEAADDTTSIEVPTQQVYIVKVADTVVKIGM